jgi:hypothetical protein
MKYGQTGEILVDQEKCATDVSEMLEDVVCYITKTAAITLQYHNYNIPASRNKSLMFPDALKVKYEL